MKALTVILALILCVVAVAGPSLVNEGPKPDTAKRIGDLFQRLMDSRHKPGDFNKRAVFAKPHTCAKASVSVSDDLPENLKVGVFAESGSKEAWVRISSDTEPEGNEPRRTSDFNKLTIGFAVKILGVNGDAPTQDFLTQNHHVFFVDTAEDFLEFTEAIFTGKFQQYLDSHEVTKKILDDMNKDVENVRGIKYWSTTPYAFGEKDFVKYKVVPNTSATLVMGDGSVVPCAATEAEAIPDAASGEHNYLRSRLQRDLLTKATCFDFQVQLRKDEMPLNKATVEWSESESVPQTVATIKIPPQDVTLNDSVCENLSFSPGHALSAHKPAGSVNEARALIYKRLGELRRSRNGVTTDEP